MNKVVAMIREFWAEMVLVPPFLVVACYVLYGAPYFASWSNFAFYTLPWLLAAIVSQIGCHWVRILTLRRFARLEDWSKRIVWNIVGYMICTPGCAVATYYVLSATRHTHLVPADKNYYGLLIVASMYVLIMATLYEGATYFGKWREAITEAEQLEKLTLETQFQSLQSQLNPHFLFNSFNVLSSLIAENPRRAEDFVDELSNVYRYLLRSNERELVSVGEELRFIRSFFHLLKTRHDTGVFLDIQVSQDHLDKKLPPLALQILVENAVKHNEVSPENPLNIEIVEVVEEVEVVERRRPHHPQYVPPPPHKILVRNNLQRKSVRPQSNHVGLDNLRQRYELLGVSGFEVQDDGQSFTVMLPLITHHS